MKTTKAFILFFISILFLGVAANAQPSAAQAAAERYSREIAAFIQTGDRAAYRKFVQANFNDEMLKLPMDRHLYFVSTLHDQTRGYELLDVQEWKANEIVRLVKGKLTGTYDGLMVRVEPNAPYKIMGLGLRNANGPAGDTKRLGLKEIGSELESFTVKLAEADVFSGAVLLAKDGRPVYKGVYGIANKDFNAPNKLDTKFNLGSMNKMFTGVAIAQLVEKGKLSYDDPLSKYVPDFPDAESAQKIKIKHLLSHTAGLGGYFTGRYQNMSRAKLRTVDDMMALAKQDEKLQFEPGSKWQYSNTGMLVLGKVIEVVSGKSYFDYIAENITRPAGMTNTGCFELDRVNTNLAVGYDKQFSDAGVVWVNNVFEHVMRGGPQGGCYSTVEDLLRFDQALRGNKLVTAETFRTLTSAKPELNSPNYGYGFQVDGKNGTAGHGGGFPGISANLEMHLSSGWTAIVLSNYSRGAQPIQTKMSTLIKASDTAAAAAKGN
jgi:CubicO group peptidase (beta-lactamase class C family)